MNREIYASRSSEITSKIYKNKRSIYVPSTKIQWFNYLIEI